MGPAGANGRGSGVPVGEWQRASQSQRYQQPKRRSRNEDSDKPANLGSEGVEPMDIKRASVCRILALAKVKVPSGNGIAQ